MDGMKKFCIYFDKLHALDDLPLQVYARVIKALVVYEQTGEKQFTDDLVANMALKLLYLDADAIANFEQGQSKFASEYGKKGAEKRWGKSKFADEEKANLPSETTENSKKGEIFDENSQKQGLQKKQPPYEAIENSKFALQPDSLKENKIKENKGSSSARARKQAQADKGRIIPPTMEMVDEYGREKGYSPSECTRFYNYYGSKDWLVGKTVMKNWHMALSNWMADKSYGNYQAKQQQAEDPYSGYTRL